MLYSSLLANSDKLSYSCQNLWFKCSAEHFLVFALVYSAKIKTIISWFTPMLPCRQTTGKKPTDFWYLGHDMSITLLETWQGMKEVAGGEPVTGWTLRWWQTEMLGSTTPINLQDFVEVASSKCLLCRATTPNSSATGADIQCISLNDAHYPCVLSRGSACWLAGDWGYVPSWFPGWFVDIIFRSVCWLSGGERLRLLLDVLKKSYLEQHVLSFGWILDTPKPLQRCSSSLL